MSKTLTSHPDFKLALEQRRIQQVLNSQTKREAFKLAKDDGKLDAGYVIAAERRIYQPFRDRKAFYKRVTQYEQETHKRARG